MAIKPVQRKRGRAAVADRARIMHRDGGLCQACKERGKVTPATVVDHIVALTNGGDDSDDNKRALCASCHDDKTAADTGKKRKRQIGLDGWPVD